MAHVSEGITQFYLELPLIHEPYLLYSPATGLHHCPLAGTHCAYPLSDGQAELTWADGYILTQTFPHREYEPRTRSPIPAIIGPGVRVTTKTNRQPTPAQWINNNFCQLESSL